MYVCECMCNVKPQWGQKQIKRNKKHKKKIVKKTKQSLAMLYHLSRSLCLILNIHRYESFHKQTSIISPLVKPRFFSICKYQKFFKMLFACLLNYPYLWIFSQGILCRLFYATKIRKILNVSVVFFFLVFIFSFIFETLFNVLHTNTLFDLFFIVVILFFFLLWWWYLLDKD